MVHLSETLHFLLPEIRYVGNLELLPSLRCEEQKTTVSNKETNPQFWLLGCVYVYVCVRLQNLFGHHARRCG
jgi:hypothetical protein